MTLPYERTLAVLRARNFLVRLSNVYVDGGIKGIRREVRQEARAVLRHFPHWFDMGRADCWDEQAAMLWANEEDKK